MQIVERNVEASFPESFAVKSDFVSVFLLLANPVASYRLIINIDRNRKNHEYRYPHKDEHQTQSKQRVMS